MTSTSSEPAPHSPVAAPANDSDDIQDTTAATANESPSAAIPIPCDNTTESENNEDLAITLVNSQPQRGGWAGLSLSAISGEAAWRQEQADRNR